MILNKSRQRGAVSLSGIVAGSLLLAALAVPVASWALQQGEKQKLPPTPPAAPGSTRGADAIRIRIWNLKPNANFRMPGAPIPGARRQNAPIVNTMPGSQVEEFVNKVVKGGTEFVGAPMVEQYSGTTSSFVIEGSSHDKGKRNTIELTPWVKGREFTIKFNLQVSFGGMPDRVLRDATGEATVGEGQAIVVLQQTMNGDGTIVTILWPTRMG